MTKRSEGIILLLVISLRTLLPTKDNRDETLVNDLEPDFTRKK